MSSSENSSHSAARVLVVDDEESIRSAVSELLATEGIHALTAADADECLATLQAGFRGVILMDVMMPDKNGWDTIREIGNSGYLKGNLISMLTAMDVPDEQMEGLQEVVIDYITKPFDPEDFIQSVRRYLLMLDQMSSGN